MSLKAYDGMMTKKGFGYLIEKIKENIPAFEEESKKNLGFIFAYQFMRYADNNTIPNATHFILTQNMTKDDEKEISKIRQDDTTILDYVYQVAQVLVKSEYANDFTSHLRIEIEPIGKKLLVYPSIFVNNHRLILLKFLEDYHAQNQTDRPNKVTKREWEQRIKDWYSFGSTWGIKTHITLFDPNSYRNNILTHFNGDELIQYIFRELPSDEFRKDLIWKENFDEHLNKVFNKRIGKLDYIISEEGKHEFEQYKQDNPIELVKIDYDYIQNQMMPKNI